MLAIKLVPTVNNAELTLVDTLAKPVIVVLPAASVVIPDTAPLNVPVLAINTQRCVADPRAVPNVLEEGTTALPLNVTELEND